MGECHSSCQHRFWCHIQCPMPALKHHKFQPKKIWKMIKHVACHAMCGSDEGCHKECPKPWAHLEAKCDLYKTVKECHQECGMDFECHHKCPKMRHGHEAKHDWHHFRQPSEKGPIATVLV